MKYTRNKKIGATEIIETFEGTTSEVIELVNQLNKPNEIAAKPLIIDNVKFREAYKGLGKWCDEILKAI